MKHYYLSLISLLLLSSCAKFDDNNFYLEFENDLGSLKFYKSNSFNSEIYDNYTLWINIPKRVEVNDSNKEKLVNFEYDEDKFNLKFINSTYYNKIYYSFQCKKLFNDQKFNIYFEDLKYEFKVSSLNPSNYNLLNESNLSSSFKEFKEMIDSISYYVYKDDYPGISSYGSSLYLGNSFSYYFKESYDLNYLKYLKDDCYYPLKFDNAYPNIVSFNFEMSFDNECDISKDSLKHTMCDFKIDLIVIDPRCTNPKNPLWNLSFEAIPLNYVSKINYINELNNDKLNERYYLLFKNYSELFLNYRINDLNIKLLSSSKNDIVGFFNDNTYSYRVKAHYER